MPMTAGTVSVDSAGVVTKSGYAGNVFDDMYAEYLVNITASGTVVPPLDQLVAVKQGLARAAVNAAKVITYIQANATAGGDAVL